MATVTSRASGIPQPVSKARTPSRLTSIQSQFQQQTQAERQKKLATLSAATPSPGAAAPRPGRPAASQRTSSDTGRTQAAPGPRGAAPPSSARARGRPAPGSAGSSSAGSDMTDLTASLSMNSSLGPGKVRAMFQARRNGNSASGSPVGWDKSYPLEPISRQSAAAKQSRTQPAASKPSKAAAPARSPAPPKSRPDPPGRLTAAPAPANSRRPSGNGLKENKPPASPSPTPRPPPSDPNLAQCPICYRHFAKDRLEKHKTICEKSNKKKRKVFDPVKMRVQGTESEQYLKKIKNTKPEKAAPKKDWRKQHEDFINNIRAAKQAQAHVAAGGKLEDLPPPPPMDTSDYVQCPHCGRRFNQAAADRHVPKCANIASNKAPSAKPAAKGRKRR